MQRLLAKAKKKPARIFFHETKDARIKSALKKITKLRIAEPVDYHKLELDNYKYAKLLMKIRQDKKWDIDTCLKKVKDPNYYGALMVAAGDCDGMIAGATQPTAKTWLPALEILAPKSGIASSCFLMLHDKPLIFADCALNVDPSAKELALIARSSAKTAELLGIKPKVALLSFSTKGSAKHQKVAKVQQATRLLKNSKFIVDGEMQFDAAFVPSVAKLKCSTSPIKGNANVFVFPDLDSGNIGYKIAQRLGNIQAIGPIVQGLKKPVNDLSRGCSVEDIVNLTAITVMQCEHLNS